MSFTHLHLHTLYSLLDGAIRMKDLIKTVKEKGMNSVAVTDHGNMFGAIDFYKKAKDAGIKPILGMEAYVAGPKGREDRSEKVSHHLILIAKNAEGYANLRYLSSTAYMHGFYYHPRIDKKVLAEHSKGLFALTACLGGEITSACFRGDMDHARRAAQEYKDIFEPGHFFLEVQSNGMPEQDKANENLKQLSRDLDIPLCATADAHYIKREDARAHELLMCIASGKTLADGKRMRHSTDKLYVTSPQEMLEFFKDTPEAVHNTQRIAEQCNLELKLGKPMLPTFKVPDSHTPDSYMAELAYEGLRERFKELAATVTYPIDREQYQARLALEIGVIQKMGFSGYFLIVQDFINWAKKMSIPVGPGRGSGAGSLVAYALRITDVDPIPYNLLFERFLNPERVSMPDFDIDFCQDRRDEVIQYVGRKYGEMNVGQIITFGSLKAKSVLRDVCRVFALPFSEGDRIAKLVPEVLNITLREAIEMEPRLKEMMESPSNIGEVEGKPVTTKDVLEIALALEGLHRQPGMHAAGVVIADKPLWEFVPVYQPPGEKTLITQFAKDEVEAAGLVKFDFLGLKTLTVIQHGLDLVKRNHGLDIPRHEIPLDDPKVWELMARGDTAGVFQMESSGFTEMVVKLKPSCFEDVIAAGALYRPGPLDSGMVDVFINRKHGREKVSYPHPALEPVLKDTYGVIVYQEQVMQISQVLGGYTLGRADLLRRAMGKKKAEVMQAERAGFLEGCAKNNVDLKVAGEIFDLMEKFAEYGFNKSHSAAYGLVTIHTAWLKAHYPCEFMAALLSSEKDNTDKVVKHIGEARESGLEVLPPDVNQSDMEFGAVNGKIRFGLGAIKGVGEGAIEAIIEARKDGPFKSLFDFCERVDSRKVNRKVMEALVKAGAFDFEKRSRRQIFDTIERAMNRGSSSQKDKAAGQSSLFGMLAAPSSNGSGGLKDDYVEVEDWSEKERLALEKEAIGFYVSGHPLHQYDKELKRYARPITAVQRARKDDKLTVAGIVTILRERPTKTGKRMAWVTIEDLSGSIELVCFPGKDGTRNVMGRDGKWAKQGPKPGFEHWEHLLKSDDPILVSGTVQISQRDEDSPTPELIVDDIQSLKAVREKRTKRLELRVPADLLTEERVAKLHELAKKYAGATPVAVSVLFKGEGEALIGNTSIKVQVNDDLLLAVDRLFGMRVVEFG